MDNKAMKNGYVRMIDLKSLIIHSLYYWKIILLITILFGLLFGFRSFNKQNVKPNDDNKTNDSYYASEREAIDSKKDEDMFLNSLESYNQAISDRYQYLNETLVKDMNPYSQPCGTLTYFIESPYSKSIANGEYSNAVSIDINTKTLLNELSNYVSYGIDWSEVKNHFNISDDIYLNELIKTAVDGNYLLVKTYYPNNEGVTYINEFIDKNTTDYYKKLQENTNLHQYTLIKLSENNTNVMNSDNFRWMINRTNEINDLVNSRESFISGRNTSLTTISGNSSNKISIKSIIKSAIKGMILGFAFSFGPIVAMLLLSNKVLSSNEVSATYNLKNITNFDNYNLLNTNTIKNILIGKKDKIEDYENKLLLAKSLLSRIHNNGGKIAVVTDCMSSESEKIANLLSDKKNKYVFVEDIVNNLKDRDVLKNIDKAIIVAATNKSKYSKLDSIISLLDDYEIEVLGTIVI